MSWKTGSDSNFPTFIATALRGYLETMEFNAGEINIGDWLLSLPLKERMEVNIQLTNDRLRKNTDLLG
jgi:hypothetical protein